MCWMNPPRALPHVNSINAHGSNDGGDMLRNKIGVRSGLRWGVIFTAAVILLTSLTFDSAEARRRKRPAGGGYSPPYAAIVVDANSGEVLHAANADALRHPASLTKMMTLYLLFEQLEAGKLKLDSEMEVSAYAASQSPSKLGLRPGSSIEVEDAIKALVTKSANDVAVVISEAIGGEEEDFAKLMTRKARALGMNKTVYKNASGLPDSDQVTSARDQATLGRALQDRFPRYYRYFATKSFYFRGRAIGNHNRLLGRVVGVDGIKTGYVRASGFNLVSSMRRGDRHIVATVLGGTSGGARDARMRSLLEGHIAEASVRRTAPKVVEFAQTNESAPRARVASADGASRVAARSEPAQRAGVPTASADPRLPVTDPRLPENVGERASEIVRAPLAAPAPGSSEPIQPIPVRTMTVKRGGAQVASAASVQVAPPRDSSPSAVSAKPGVLGTLTGREIASAGAGFTLSSSNQRAAPPPPIRRDGWIIQIGAVPGEGQAQDLLKSAQSVARTMLGTAEPFTERVNKGETTLYRARFAGFDREKAEATCKYLKKNEISCLALKN